MRVFVTGGGRGFIGGHLVRALEEAGHEVVREFVDVRDRAGLTRAFHGAEELRLVERPFISSCQRGKRWTWPWSA